MAKTLKQLTATVDKFVEDRNWDNSDPCELLTSIMIELGELAEHYQWKNVVPEFKGEEKAEVGFEFVDVLFYILKLASLSGIDIEAFFDKKLPLLEKKFPVGGDVKQAHEHYRKTGKNKLYK